MAGKVLFVNQGQACMTFVMTRGCSGHMAEWLLASDIFRCFSVLYSGGCYAYCY